ncbi:MAG TPA: anti-sigma factor [Patescibacteria group bacterium]|nr:anti-sigma factor [Patescibacteria group bacterium]
MDHAEVRERLELAAVEPGELDRLAAGDTPDAAAIAGHLAGCPACAEEAHRLARLVPLVREAAQTIPPEALRAQTLDLVRTVGRPRGANLTLVEPSSRAGAGSSSQAAVTPVSAPVGVVPADPAEDRRPPRRRLTRVPATIAAVVALVLLAGGAVYAVQQSQQHAAESAALAELNTATLRVSALPDSTRVELTGTSGNGEPAKGTLLFSPATTELVISSPNLAAPAAGQQYACWMERPDGSRSKMGYMDFGGGLAYWSGWNDHLRDAGPGTKFGITLIGADGHPVDGDTMTGAVDRT